MRTTLITTMLLLGIYLASLFVDLHVGLELAKAHVMGLGGGHVRL